MHWGLTFSELNNLKKMALWRNGQKYQSPAGADFPLARICNPCLPLPLARICNPCLPPVAIRATCFGHRLQIGAFILSCQFVKDECLAGNLL
jgi:hypothetical protein